MTLIKKAEGLQKFTLNCGFWRSPKYVGVSLGAIGLQTAAISYCYEHATDGRLPKGHEAIAAALGLRASQVRTAMKDLLVRGIWIEHETCTEVANYLDHNPSAKEVRDHREKREQAAMKANHKRWHSETPDLDCPLCLSESVGVSESDSQSESSTDSPLTEPTNVTNSANELTNEPSQSKQDFSSKNPNSVKGLAYCKKCETDRIPWDYDDGWECSECRTFYAGVRA